MTQELSVSQELPVPLPVSVSQLEWWNRLSEEERYFLQRIYRLWDKIGYAGSIEIRKLRPNGRPGLAILHREAL